MYVGPRVWENPRLGALGQKKPLPLPLVSFTRQSRCPCIRPLHPVLLPNPSTLVVLLLVEVKLHHSNHHRNLAPAIVLERENCVQQDSASAAEKELEAEPSTS